jgi:lactoylglutathione lyase
MRIEHVAIWTRDIEKLRNFYVKYFQVTVGEKYVNVTKNFQSYFLTFENGCRLELMQMPGISDNSSRGEQYMGLTHIAIAVGSKENVDDLTRQLQTDGYDVVGYPRTTGDGYYESVILDPEGNRIEITV